MMIEKMHCKNCGVDSRYTSFHCVPMLCHSCYEKEEERCYECGAKNTEIVFGLCRPCKNKY